MTVKFEFIIKASVNGTEIRREVDIEVHDTEQLSEPMCQLLKHVVKDVVEEVKEITP